jgi:hypothetical protein
MTAIEELKARAKVYILDLEGRKTPAVVNLSDAMAIVERMDEMIKYLEEACDRREKEILNLEDTIETMEKNRPQ